MGSFLLNFVNGNVSPGWVSLFFLGERFHFSSHIFLSLAWYSCLVAEVLFGRGDCRICGRLAEVLDHPSAAFFARWSACSFPVTSLWLEIHLIVSLHCVLLVALRRACIKYCSVDVLGDLRVSITD